ncbi:MAG: hypothetical protein AAGE43_05250 [Pseudomonadota bacterium]
MIDIGEVPTPLLYFATHALDTGPMRLSGALRSAGHRDRPQRDPDRGQGLRPQRRARSSRRRLP